MQKLRELRKEKGFTMKQVAESIGVAECTYCAYEHGTRKPSFEMYIKLARVFGVSIEAFIDKQGA